MQTLFKQAARQMSTSTKQWLTPEVISTIKATAPVVAQHAEQITSHFYKTMFKNNPEVKAFFNPAHQASGQQPRALAGAVIAYASHIDNLGVLGSAVELMAQKHVSVCIVPEQYAIVGKNLMIAIGDVLGAAVTPEIAHAWESAYMNLAEILINREAEIYKAQREAHGGWNFRREFVLDRKVQECDAISSFYFRPKDNEAVMAHEPGQYTAIYLPKDKNLPVQPRNYSLSSSPSNSGYRITVKKIAGMGPDGVVSSYLHNEAKEGDVFELCPPAGNFTLNTKSLVQRPAVFLSAGVGITPLASMASQASTIAQSQPMHFIYTCKNSSLHPLRKEIDGLAAANSNFNVHYAYTSPSGQDQGLYNSSGRLNTTKVLEIVNGNKDCDFYVCGPKEFMADLVGGLKSAGVSPKNIHYEFFGPLQRI